MALEMILERLPLLRGLLDFVFPPLCSGCGEFTENRYAVCKRCLESIDWHQRPFCLTCGGIVETEKGCRQCETDSFPLYSAGNYADPLQQIVIRYKFHSATGAAALIATKVSEQFAPWLAKYKPVLLVPIPLHPGREHRRGYNQATLFATELGKLLDMDVNDGIIFRTKKRKPQSKLKQAARAANIKGVFAVGGDAAFEVETQKLILVDDVVTSGQTVLEARKTLQASGYEVVAVIAMAHGF